MINEQLASIGSHYDGYWAWALNKSRKERDTPRSGKWMLWPVGEEAIEVWQVIVELTQQNILGSQAKISCREEEKEHVICVYTLDSDDLSDLQRIVNKLRESIDPKHRLIYKENSMTCAGVYKGSGKIVSKWYVKPYETTIHQVKDYKSPQEGETDEGSREPYGKKPIRHQTGIDYDLVEYTEQGTPIEDW